MIDPQIDYQIDSTADSVIDPPPHPIDLHPRITHYLCPRTVDEAVQLHTEYGQNACWVGGWALAGRALQNPVTCAIALDQIRVQDEGLNAVRESDGTLRIGALASLQDIMDHPDIPPVLKAAAALEPSRALRCTMTLGGDVAARRPDSHLPTALMALGALLELAGDAAIGINHYSSRHQRDLILCARVPLNRQAALSRHQRSARGAVLLTAAVGWDQDGGNAIVAVEGAGLPLCRIPEAEHLLNTQGEDLSLTVLEKTVRKTVHPEADWMGSASYKAYMVAISVADCVLACRQGRVLCC